MKARRHSSVAAMAMALCAATAVIATQEIRLRVGTVVPRGSLWHDTLQYIAQDWQRIVGPGLKVVIRRSRKNVSEAPWQLLSR